MAKPRHSKPSATKRNIQRAATATTGSMAVIAISATSTPALAAPANVWAEVIDCESGGDPTAQNPTSTASGLYQIIDGTWASYGGLDYAPKAKLATIEEQGIVAERVLAGQGAGAWGTCGASLAQWVAGGSQEAPAAVPAPLPLVEPAAPVASPPVAVSGGDRVVETARGYFGAEYVWGGESYAEGGFDCSGLVYSVYKELGIDLPRSSRAMAGAGSAVDSVDSAQAGDLLLFDTDGDGVINHVGIYVSPGRMIDSADYGQVVQERDIWATPVAVRHIDVAGTEIAPVATETPIDVPAPVQTDQKNYTVVEGDWLSKIAQKVGEDWNKLYEENKVVIGNNPNLIYPGQVLLVGGLPLTSPPVTVVEETEEVVVEPVAPEVQVSEAVINNSAGPVSPRTQAAADAVFSNVRGASLISIGGTRPSARDPQGHPSGNALDYMVLSDAALGDAIAQYNIDNWDILGVEYIIWQQRILTSPDGAWEWMPDRGSITENHYDHVHVNYN